MGGVDLTGIYRRCSFKNTDKRANNNPLRRLDLHADVEHRIIRIILSDLLRR